MPRLKSTRVKTLRKKKRSKKIPAEFEDIAVYFSREEWGYLEEGQKELYRQVMMDNYQTFCTTGSCDKKPKLISRLEHGEDPTQRRPGRPPIKRLAVSSFQKGELFTPDGSAVEGIRLVDDLEEVLPIPVKKDSLETKRRYNFRDRVAVEYSIFFDDEIRELKRKKGLRGKLSHHKIERIDGPMPSDKNGDMASSNYQSDASSHRSDELHTSLITPDGSAVEGLRLIDDLEEDLPIPVKEDILDTKRRYNFRDRVGVEYSIFFDDEIRDLKRKKDLPVKLSHDSDDEIRDLKRKKDLPVKLSHDKIEQIDGPMPDDKNGDMPSSNCPPRTDASSHRSDELHTSLITPDGSAVEGIRLIDDLQEDLPIPVKEDILDTKRRYNFRDRVGVEYSIFFDDEIELKRKKGLRDTSSHRSDELHTSLITPDGSAVEGIRLIDDLEDLPTPVKVDSLDTKRRYNFRDRVEVEYSIFFDDEIRELKRKKGLRGKLSHDKIERIDGLYPCSECGKKYKQKASLAIHQRLHTGVSCFVCMKCDKCFTHRSFLRKHEKIHAGKRPFACNECEKRYTDPSTLQKHQRLHSGYKPYKCSECDKTFSISNYLIVHQRTHTGEKPYICGQCGKGFTQCSSLITHKRVHTGVRPFTCIECGRGFTTSSHLITHQRTHTGEKPYQCKECGMAFNHSTHLVLHKRKHTGEKPFSCDNCKMKFTQRTHLHKHQQKYHEDEDE